ncbi:MAG: ABC transporter ATP-binding protein [Actinomycetota bacterium]
MTTTSEPMTDGPRTPEERAASEGTPPALELDHVTKRFGEVVAVDDVSLRVARGEFFSLLGPSGCGKTTTLRMLAGFEEPSDGRLLLDGVEATQIPPFKRPTNLVFQNYALFPHMSVYRNVAFGPRRAKLPKDETDRRVREALSTVQMDALADRMPSQMSGGQQQRVGLARALVNDPLVLLLDEPLGALDLKLRKEMQIELKRIQREVGISFVYVTHDQEEAMTMSDRIAVMDGGRVEQLGTPREIYFRPTSRFVADFIGTANLLPGTIERIGETTDVRYAGTVLPAASIGAPPGTTPAIGDEVALMLRPESIDVHRERPPAGHVVPTTVEDVIFQGTGLRLELRGPDGVAIVAIVTVVSVEGREWRPGDEAFLTWDEGRAHVVADRR